MSEPDALLAAVLADPDDDTVRLVYADRLQESGRPASIARARFVRLQIAQATGLPYEQSVDAQRELDALARWWARAWLAELPPAVADAVWKQRLGAAAFRRGFVNGVTLPVAVFRECAAGLFAAAPITTLHLHGGFGARQAAGLFACPFFRRLRAVRLSGGAIGGRVAHHLSKCPDLGAVRELDLSGCGLTDAGAVILSRFVARGVLDVLCVRHNRLTAAGIDALAEAVPSGAVTRIAVAGNRGAEWSAARWRGPAHRLLP